MNSRQRRRSDRAMSAVIQGKRVKISLWEWRFMERLAAQKTELREKGFVLVQGLKGYRAQDRRAKQFPRTCTVSRMSMQVDMQFLTHAYADTNVKMALGVETDLAPFNTWQTGRLSHSKPEVQDWPKTEEQLAIKKQLRELFGKKDVQYFIGVDYADFSANEVRIHAQLRKDPK